MALNQIQSRKLKAMNAITGPPARIERTVSF